MATIVLVSGFLAPADEGVLRGYWSGFSAYLDESTAGARVLVARELSPVGSLHDRALQLFGELYGGAVTADVARGGAGAGAGAGAQSLSPSPSPPPSAAHHRGAKRGRLGVWDEEHPVHLVGHSYGGQTCRVLHEYLARGLFRCGGEPVRSSSAWVRSVTCVNAPLNGSRVVHALGLPRGSPYVAPFSAGYWLTLLMENAARFGPERLAAAIRMPPAHLRGSLPRRLRQLLHNIVGSSRVTGTGDSAASDLSPAASAAWNRFLRTHGTTYYLSIAGSAAATPAPGPARLSPLQLFKAAFLWTMAARRRRAAAAAAAAPCGCGRVDCEACEILGDSDGVAGTNSQGSPPGAPRCAAQLFDLEGGGASVARRGAESVVAPGVWHVQEAACDHLCLAGLPTSDPRASRFADQLVALLRTVDKAGARAGARAGAAADGIGRAAAPPALAKPRAEPPGGDSGGALGAAVLLAPLGGIGAALFATASVAEAALLTAALALTLAAFRRRAPRPADSAGALPQAKAAPPSAAAPAPAPLPAPLRHRPAASLAGALASAVYAAALLAGAPAAAAGCAFHFAALLCAAAVRGDGFLGWSGAAAARSVLAVAVAPRDVRLHPLFDVYPAAAALLLWRWHVHARPGTGAGRGAHGAWMAHFAALGAMALHAISVAVRGGGGGGGGGGAAGWAAAAVRLAATLEVAAIKATHARTLRAFHYDRCAA